MTVNWPEDFPSLNTERLILRQVKPSDSQGIYECYSNPGVMRYMGTPLTEPGSVRGIVEDYMNCLDQGSGIVWALERKNTGEFLGTAGFEEFFFLDLKAQTSFTILPEHSGKGYMTEAMKAIIRCGFHTLGLNRIEALIHTGNEPALSLARRLGFVKEGTLRRSVFFNGGFHDLVMLSVLQNEFSHG